MAVLSRVTATPAHGKVREILVNEVTWTCVVLQGAGAGPQYLCNLVVERGGIISEAEFPGPERVLWPKKRKTGVPREKREQTDEGRKEGRASCPGRPGVQECLCLPKVAPENKEDTSISGVQLGDFFIQGIVRWLLYM